MSNVLSDVKAQLRTYTDKAIAGLENRMRRSMRAMRFWPQEITESMTIPKGTQVVLDILTIAEGATLTVNGHLNVRMWVKNYGHIVVSETGSFRRG